MPVLRGRRPTLFYLAVLLPGALFADYGIDYRIDESVTVAVASNFAATAARVSAAFTETSGIPVRISAGSTGKLYAQIINGAPFDVFLAADTERPLLLERSGLIVSGSRQTYAIGSLVLWSRDARLKGKDCQEVLRRGEYGKLALANPETAPYGSAAREALEASELWDTASKRAVYGENISQTLQFVATGNATLGFVARSQLVSANLPTATCVWEVPTSIHKALHQQVVLLNRAKDDQGAQRFVDFLSTEMAKRIIRDRGYGVPD